MPVPSPCQSGWRRLFSRPGSDRRSRSAGQPALGHLSVPFGIASLMPSRSTTIRRATRTIRDAGRRNRVAISLRRAARVSAGALRRVNDRRPCIHPARAPPGGPVGHTCHRLGKRGTLHPLGKYPRETRWGFRGRVGAENPTRYRAESAESGERQVSVSQRPATNVSAQGRRAWSGDDRRGPAPRRIRGRQ